MPKSPKKFIPDDVMDEYLLENKQASPGNALKQAFIHEAPDKIADLKSRASATTLYLMPKDHKRLGKIAIDREISFQTLVMDALDGLLAEVGEHPVQRWKTRRKQK